MRLLDPGLDCDGCVPVHGSRRARKHWRPTVAERTTPGARAALTIAASDCSGGGGIQADLRTFSVMGVYGAAVVTAVTVANRTGVRVAQVLDPDLVEQQIS